MTNPGQPDERRWFIHRVDARSGRGIFVQTSRAQLREQSFLDGRSRFWQREENRALPKHEDDQTPHLRFIFHVSFCGSTLLARLLDAPGRVLSLREPHAYVDLANQVTANGDGLSASPMEYARLLAQEMRATGAAGEQVVVKPSNWANSLIPYLCAPELGATAVFMSMSLPSFLLAVLRGGRDRLTYAAQAAAHLTSKTGLGAGALELAVKGTSDPVGQVVRIAAVSHLVQERLFRTAMAARNWPEDHWIDFDQLIASPGATASQAGLALGLPVDEEELVRKADGRLEAHSKDQSRSFSAARRVQENAEVIGHHGALIADVLKWSQEIAI